MEKENNTKEKKVRKPRTTLAKQVEPCGRLETVESCCELKAIEAPSLRKISKDTTLFDWKSLIPSKYVDISNFWYSQEGIVIKETTEAEREELKERCGEENLIIKLAGFKHIAHLRGMTSVDYRVEHISPEHVSAQCQISFNEAIVTDGDKEYYFPRMHISGVANATTLNTSYPFSMFLESMAENRAFIRAIKTAFNINILGAEELQIQSTAQTSLIGDEEGCKTPQESLKGLVLGKGKSFPDLLESLKKKKWANCEKWKDFADVPSEECIQIINNILSKVN